MQVGFPRVTARLQANGDREERLLGVSCSIGYLRCHARQQPSRSRPSVGDARATTSILASYSTSTCFAETRVVRAVRSYVIPGGTEQAHPTDAEGLFGMSVDVPRNFWSRADLAGYSDASFPCVVAAECVREFRHPDGLRSRTY